MTLSTAGNDSTREDSTPLLKPDEDVVAQDLGDSTVLVNLRTNRIYSLNRTGTRFWELASSGRSEDEIVETMLGEFSIEKDELISEIGRLASELRKEGLAG